MTRYEKLVERVYNEWENKHKDDRGAELVLMPKVEGIKDWKKEIREINLWNYWQGNISHKADVMLVGQDWGNPSSDDCKVIIDNILNGRNYLDDVKSISPTDRNLIELFSVLKKNDKALFPDIKNNKYENLFFTNFSLGYRTGKITGGMTKAKMRKDEEFFQELCEIVDPKIIIALGIDTYECVVAALGYDNFKYKKAIDFWKELNTGKNNQPFTINKHEAVVFGVAHCGAFGVNVNRPKHSNNTANDGLELMKKDWKRINPYIEKYL